ncbi:hypothetical protein Cni_G00275 [Canna indica]|uniref:Protein kinase domain-containing protein n=1 Tax=Canna indica TaxID=4628 RepID=A0AAQ3PZ88_9LILI|nr:hypothetical protein Cni_G00275 [Canna indica]
MGNCCFQRNPFSNKVSSALKEESPRVQSPKMKEEEIRKLPSNAKEVEDLRRETSANPLVAFTFNELKVVTENFKKENVLGVGGFGCVYRGFITQNLKKGLQPLQVAVKVHDAKNSNQGHREWLVRIIVTTLMAALLQFKSQFSILWSSSGHLTAMSDVYSFGVVLLELLTGKRSLDKSRPVRQQALVEWVAPFLTQKKRVLSIIDPRLCKDYPEKAVQRVARLAYHCLNHNPKARPLMRDVVGSLEPLQESCCVIN